MARKITPKPAPVPDPPHEEAPAHEHEKAPAREHVKPPEKPHEKAPRTTEAYRDLYETSYVKAMSGDFVPVFLNGMREHADRMVYIMKTIKKLAPVSILDMPCGYGFQCSLVRWQRGYAPTEVHGADISDQALGCARKVGYDVTHLADLTKPFDIGRKYDLVLCMEFLEHVHEESIPVVIENALKHRTDGGHVLFSTPVEGEAPDGAFHVRRVTEADWHIWLARYPGLVHSIEFLPSEFAEKPRWLGWNFITVGKAT